MPVWLTLLGAVLGTVFFFGGLFALILFVTGRQRWGAKPKLVVVASNQKELSVAMNWDPNVYLVEVYRIVLNLYAPDSREKDGKYTYTFEDTQKGPFIQPILLPELVNKLLGSPNQKGILSFAVHTTDGYCLGPSFRFQKLRKLFGSPKEVSIPNVQPMAALGQDIPSVASLEYAELQERKKKLDKLKGLAKAKEAKQKPAPVTPAAGKPEGAEVSVAPKNEKSQKENAEESESENEKSKEKTSKDKGPKEKLTEPGSPH